MNMEFVNLKQEEISLIKPFWEELNRIHLEDSVYFKGHFSEFTFEKRRAQLEDLNDDHILITVVKVDKKIIGYCLSSIRSGNGEIDSVYIVSEFRGMGFGRELVDMHINRLMSKGARRIRTSVAHGHEQVLGFYGRLGFYPRMTVLEKK